MKNEKPITVYTAIAANLVIAVSKFIVSVLTGSSAMLAEAIHSTADTGNELLLLLGLKRSKKPADRQHPFGYGQELYFWGLIVALILFGAGAGMSIYEGLTRLSHPSEPQNIGWNYVVLAIALAADGTSWTVAFRQLLKDKTPQESFWHSLRASKDPSTFIVFGEDTADLAGLLVAFIGIFLGHLIHSGYPDVIASILVGLILAVLAIYLAYESKSLLIGEKADTEIIMAVKEIVESHEAVEKAGRPLTVQLGPDNVFLALGVQFKPDLPASDLASIIVELKTKIREAHESVRQIFIEAEESGEEEGQRRQPRAMEREKNNNR